MLRCMWGGNQGASVADFAAHIISKSAIALNFECPTCFAFPVDGGECDQRAHENCNVCKGDGKSHPVDVEHGGPTKAPTSQGGPLFFEITNSLVAVNVRYLNVGGRQSHVCRCCLGTSVVCCKVALSLKLNLAKYLIWIAKSVSRDIKNPPPCMESR